MSAGRKHSNRAPRAVEPMLSPAEWEGGWADVIRVSGTAEMMVVSPEPGPDGAPRLTLERQTCTDTTTVTIYQDQLARMGALALRGYFPRAMVDDLREDADNISGPDGASGAGARGQRIHALLNLVEAIMPPREQKP